MCKGLLGGVCVNDAQGGGVRPIRQELHLASSKEALWLSEGLIEKIRKETSCCDGHSVPVQK